MAKPSRQQPAAQPGEQRGEHCIQPNPGSFQPDGPASASRGRYEPGRPGQPIGTCFRVGQALVPHQETFALVANR
jgi:hypothetical protein